MIKAAELVNFRVFQEADLEFADGATAIVGKNGAGKSSVLEALYLLGHGRSHRSADRRALISKGQDVLRIIGAVDSKQGAAEVRLALELRRSGDLLASVDRQVARTLASFLQLAPVMLIDGDVQEMFSSGAMRRRRLLDWGVFHVEHRFSETWREYQRALRQRNAALKLGSAQQARMWDAPLCEFGEGLHAMRAAYVSRVDEALVPQIDSLLGAKSVLAYRRGWDGDLQEALKQSLLRDLRMGFTSVGPHRADLLAATDTAVAGQLSRGQQKLLAMGLLLAQVHVHAAADTPRATVLIDDAGADLDVDNLGKVYGALRTLPAQLIVTSIDERALERLQISRMFHVEQGSIRLIP